MASQSVQPFNGGFTLGPRGTGPQIVAKPSKFSRTLDTLWSIDSQKKISKFDATSCQILRLNAQNLISAGALPQTQLGFFLSNAKSFIAESASGKNFLNH